MVASGGQDFNFERNDPEEKVIVDILTSDDKGQEEICNGLHSKTEGSLEGEKNNSEEVEGIEMRAVGDKASEDDVNTTVTLLTTTSDGSANEGLTGSPILDNAQNHKPDPVQEVCRDLEVKIADLGNACWVVS